MNFKTEIKHLALETTNVIIKLLDQNASQLEERLICAEIAEHLQLRQEQYIAITERPYGDGSQRDSKADIRFFSRGKNSPFIWVELKPMMYSSPYWYFPKFFNKNGFKPENPHLSNSIILNDIDRIDLLDKRKDIRPNVFAMVFVIRRGADSLELDPTPPILRKAITLGQALYLVELRFKAKLKVKLIKEHISSNLYGGFEIFVFATLCS